LTQTGPSFLLFEMTFHHLSNKFMIVSTFKMYVKKLAVWKKH